ncbi:ABC transporter permease [Natronosporangium hydrolyticum]|uniref:ABC transporter permease n=1 Tax=Natronosporangium hydrolyticum TaxID=2811111 RepID=A0A895YII9_9ACTN|nr:ABC transporter permease [Natronosporangium hydrolyticum]QSB15862.1 ABC transporter permease [Natronosporangium hydrolyticum]
MAAGTGGRGRRWVTAASPVLLPVASAGLVLTLWWGAVVAFDIPRILLPGPAEVVSELIRLRHRLWEQGLVTLTETVVGFGITTVAGLLLGSAIAASRIVDQATTPWLVAFNAVPKVALAPMLVVWLNLGMQPRIAMVVLVSFFPVVLATSAGLRSTPVELVELARSWDASRWRTFAKVRFPYALPQIFMGLKIAMPLALIGAVVGEFAGGNTGLAFVIRTASAGGNTALAFAAIVVLSLMGIGLFYAVVALERLLLPWVRAVTA